MEELEPLCCYLLTTLPKRLRRGILEYQKGCREAPEINYYLRWDLEEFVKTLPATELTKWFHDELLNIIKSKLDTLKDNPTACQKEFISGILQLYSRRVEKVEEKEKKSFSGLLEWRHNWFQGPLFIF